MAYLNKKQYEYREFSANRRNTENVQIAMENGMNEDCAELLSSLCTIRHKLHTSIDELVKSSSEVDVYKEIRDIIDSINISELPQISVSVTEIDDMYLLDYCGDLDDENGDRDEEKYNSEYERIYKEWEQVNESIENYLRLIDKKYNTNFAPTGALRIY